MATNRLAVGGNTPLFERMLELDPLDVVHALAIKAHQMYMAMTPTNISQTATTDAENDLTKPVYDMLRDWKYTEQWVERSLLSFRRADTERQLDTLGWLVVLMRTCKSIGDLHHASAIHTAITNPSIIRLPDVHDAYLVLLNKKQALETVEIITNRVVYEQYLARRLESKASTTPMLRPLMDYLRYSTTEECIKSSSGPNSKLIKMFATILSDDDTGPRQQIEQYLVFQALEFETTLQKRSLRRRSDTTGIMDIAVSQFLKEAIEIGELTYSQPNVLISLSNRLLPWPDMFPADSSFPKTAQARRGPPRLASSIRLEKRGSSKAIDDALNESDHEPLSRSMSISIESPLQTLCECFWGQEGSSPAQKREKMLPVLDDLVMQASQRPSQFPAGDWEAILIEALSCLEEGDERPFRLLIITESTLQNWHFENRPLGMAARLKATNTELTAGFGTVDETTDLQRLLLFSLCSLVSHHVHEFRHEYARPQWTNLKELMQIVLNFVFAEDGPLVFRSVDALYNEGRCLDEGLLLVCDQILNKTLIGDLDEVVLSTGDLSPDARNQFRKTVASLRSVHAVVREAISTLDLIKSFSEDDRQYRLIPAVKTVRLLLIDSKKTFESSRRMTSRLKDLMPFKSFRPAAPKSKKNKDGSMATSACIVGRLACLVLAESIERFKSHREQRCSMIRRVSASSNRGLPRRKSLSVTELTTRSIGNTSLVEEEAVALAGFRKPSQQHHHTRRRSSSPTKVIIQDLRYGIINDESDETDVEEMYAIVEDVVEQVKVASENRFSYQAKDSDVHKDVDVGINEAGADDNPNVDIDSDMIMDNAQFRVRDPADAIPTDNKVTTGDLNNLMCE